MANSPKKIKRPWVKERKPFERERTRDAFDYNCRRWRKVAKLQLQKHPLCAHCKLNGIVTAGNVCDHIIPIEQGGDPWAETNHQTLCDRRGKSCHERKSSTEKRS
jgi:5-methylcytosine-specific restriction protein A